MPRSDVELEMRLAEKPWAQPHHAIISAVVAECRIAGLLGGDGHVRALRDRLFNYAVGLLAHSARTEQELRRRLSRPVWSAPELVDDVMDALKRYGYIDDEAFARRFAERRAAAGKSGARLLRLELRARGVRDREAIDAAVSEAFERTPEADAIDALIEKRTRTRPVANADDLRRLRDFLLRRGFEPETVYEKLRSIKPGEVEDEYD